MEAINLEAGDYLARDGVIYPIVSYLGDDGIECEWYEAVAAVAGGGATWFALNLADFKERSQ